MRVSWGADVMNSGIVGMQADGESVVEANESIVDLWVLMS
jgi:predicted ribosome-associated RNA-binding protein Tma20